MVRRAILTSLLLLSLLSCARQPQRGVGGGMHVEVPDRFRGEELQTTWLYTEGVRLLALDEQESAYGYLGKVLEIDSLHAPTNGRFAELFLSYDNARALHHATIAYEQDTTNLHHANIYGYALMSNGRVDDAIRVYEKLVAQEPKRVANHTLLAYLYARKGLPYKAISVLDSAEYKLGRVSEIVEPKRNLLIKTKLYDRALGETLSDVANNPNRAENYGVLGELYAAMGRDSLAEANLKRALELNPQRLTSQLAMANFYHSKGRESDYLGAARGLFLNDELALEDKLSIYDTSIVHDEGFYRRNFFAINTLISTLHLKYPDDYEVSLRYANHLIRAGELQQALDQFKALTNTPFVPREALDNVINIENYLGRRDSMMHYLDKAIERYPDEESFRFRKGYVLLGEEGREREARGIFEQIAKQSPNGVTKSDAYAVLGNEEVNPNKAARYYRKALKHNPDNAMALNNWAYVLCTHGGNLQQALQMSQRACELEPTNATYLDTKAWALHLLGRSAEAKRTMQQAISLDTTGDSTLLLHYGDILAAEGEVFMAEIYYKRALEAGEEPQLIEERIEGLRKTNNTKTTK